MLRKALPFAEFKAAADKRSFEGYTAAYTRDLGGDIILPGSFEKSINERLAKRAIKIRWLHYDPMGVVVDAHEDSKGLWMKGEVPPTQTNSERLELMEAGVVDKLSIGYDTVRGKVEFTEDTRILSEVKWYESSPVDLPMNEDTSIDTIKSLIQESIHNELNAESIAELFQAKVFTIKHDDRVVIESTIALLQGYLAGSTTPEPEPSTPEPVDYDDDVIKSFASDMSAMMELLRG